MTQKQAYWYARILEAAEQAEQTSCPKQRRIYLSVLNHYDSLVEFVAPRVQPGL